MFTFPTVFVGKRFVYRGKIATAIGETDSGQVKLRVGGEEVWTDFNQLQDIDGASPMFRVLPLLQAA